MKYYVLHSFRVKTSQGEKTIQTGQIISLPEEKAAALIKDGKIKPFRDIFDDLFHKHMEKMKVHHLTADGIKARDPEALRAIHAAIREMDAAWLREDLPAFKEAMSRAEGIYLEALERLWRQQIERN